MENQTFENDFQETSDKQKYTQKNKKNYSNYSQRFLERGATPEDFFNEISHKVDLTSLYKVDEILLESGSQNAYPVIIEITDPYLIQLNQAKYLFQLWNQLSEKIFEQPLKEKFQFFKTNEDFVFIVSGQNSEESEMLSIRSLSKPLNCVKVLNLLSNATQSILFQVQYKIIVMFVEYDKDSEILYVGNHDEIIITKLEFSKILENAEQPVIIDSNNLTKRNIFPKLKLHGIYNNYFAFETQDNQLDFNRIEINNFESDDANFSYTFTQYAEIFPRNDVSIDPIVKIINQGTGFGYCISLRKSGKFDLYWDMQRRFSSDFSVSEIDMTLDAFYFKIITQDQKQQYWRIQYENCRSLSWEMAEEISDKEFNFQKLKYSKSKQYVNLYKGMIVDSFQQNTYTIVAHQSTFSLYNINKNRWIKHVTFQESQISHMFQLVREDDVKDIVVILNNGSTYFITYKSLSTPKQNQLVIDASQKSFQFEHKVETVSVQVQNYKFAVVKLAEKKEDQDIKHFYIINDRLKHRIEPREGEQSSTVYYLPIHQTVFSESLMFLLKIDSSSDEKSFTILIINHKTIQSEYEEQEEEKDQKETEEDNINKDETQDFNDTLNEDLNISQTNQLNKSLVKDDYIPSKRELEYTVQKKLKDYDQAYQYQRTIESPHTVICLNRQLEKEPKEPSEKRQVIYEGVQQYNFDFTIIIEERDMNIFYNKQNRFFIKYNTDYVYNFLSISEYYNYAITNSGEGGLQNFDLTEALEDIENTEFKSLQFQSYELGNNKQLVFCKKEDRIAYFNTLTHITVVPLLHTNQIKFIGMNDISDYLATKVEADNFYVLNKKGKIQSWNLLTGKFQGFFKLSNSQWLSEYQTHDPEDQNNHKFINRRDKVLLNSINEATDQKYSDFYEPFQMTQNLDNQITYIENLKFYHPKYEFQYLYISSDMQLMIERQLFSKVYLFKAIQLGKNQVKWQLIRKLEDYDRDIESSILTHVPFYSPDFSYHISLDRRERQFVIKETITNKVFANIPKDLLTFDISSSTEKPIFAVNRIQWVDNRLIRIVNNQGIEKLIDFQNNFEEIAFNTIPEFSKQDIIEDLPYFYERSILSREDTEESLLRKYQNYKSQYYLFGRTDQNSLYNILFNVEKSNLLYSQLSFTYLHWSLIKQISDNKLQFEDINDQQVQPLLYNIFPRGNTVLHIFCESDQGDDIQTLIKASQGVATTQANIDYHIPIIQNIEHESPLHIAKRLNDFRSIDNLLKYLSVYESDHHSKAIKDLIPYFIEKDLPSLPNYLESRLQQNEQVKTIQKAQLKENYEQILPFELWYLKADFDKKNIDLNAIESRIKCEYIDIPSSYHYADPDFQDLFNALSTTENFEIFKLKSVQSIINFNFPLVKKYTVLKLFIPYIIFLGIFTTYFNMFSPHYKQVYADRFQDPGTYYDLKKFDQMFLGSLVIFAIYFLANEVRQLALIGYEYFLSIWNYIDILPPLGLLVTTAFYFLGTDTISDSVQRQVAALTTFFMWIKLLYFLRIFQNTGYLIRMIITVIYDMRVFFLVLLIGLFAFSNTFLMISLGNPSEPVDDNSGKQFTTGFINSIIYSYSVILGGFDLGDYDNSIAYAFVICLFLICTIFNMIVMLNLLIAIISESFANVNNNAKNAMYQEMASLISENNYLIPDQVKDSYAKKNLHLMVITDLEAFEPEFSDPVKNQIAQLQSYIEDDIATKINNIQFELNFKFANSTLEFGTIKEKLGDLSKMMVEMSEKHAEVKKE